MWNHTHPNRHFRKNISAPRGCCAPKFLHVLENDQILLAHTPTGTGVTLQFFYNGSKIGLTFSELASITLVVKGLRP